MRTGKINIFSPNIFNFTQETKSERDPYLHNIYPYYNDVCYDSHGDNIDYLYKLRLGSGWSRERYSEYKIPKRNRKEEYICTLELVNRIEELAKELIKDYAPAVSEKIVKEVREVILTVREFSRKK